jgi:peptidoglycan/xylan/chitin deacetylase (PgdA/CDA1 family)
VIPNVEFFALTEPMPGGTGKVPDVPNYAIRDYGVRVAVWRFIEVFKRYSIRATVALNSDVCDAYPEFLDETTKLGWEFMGHNQTNTRRLNDMPLEEEPSVIHETLVRIQEATGKKPVGWLSSGLQETWNTLEHLIHEGCRYVADWVNDDQPYLMSINGKQIVSLPYSLEINDKRAIEIYHLTAEEFDQMIRRQFDVLYREGASSGRVMAIALHPYLTGVPHRIDALDSALNYICAHEGVWLATGSEITDHYLASNPAG